MKQHRPIRGWIPILVGLRNSSCFSWPFVLNSEPSPRRQFQFPL
jgi:hypothetical protein